MAGKSGKKKIAKCTRTVDINDKSGLIEELKARNLVLEKELESMQEDFRAQTGECRKENDERENCIRGRKQAEEALRESQERLRLAQKVAHIGTFEWNIQTGVNTWTPELEAMYGLPPGGFPGTEDAWEQLVYPEDRPEALQRVNEAMEKGGFEGEWRVVWPDGSVHWLHGRAFVFKDETGKPLKLIGINMDITRRRQMEEELRRSRDEFEQRVQERTKELRESEERFRALADNIPNLAWIANPDGWIFWYNKQWYDYTGTTLEEMQGWGWQKVHHPDYVKAVTEEWSSRIKAGLPYDNIFPLRSKDGNYRWFLTRVTPIKDYQGNIQRWFGTNTDITERKQAEDGIAGE